MPLYVTPAIALVAAIAAVASLLVSLHSSRRADRDSARDEALALAETRGQLLQELRADYELRTRRLEAALAELMKADSVPDEGPGDIERALARIQEELPGTSTRSTL